MCLKMNDSSSPSQPALPRRRFLQMGGAGLAASWLPPALTSYAEVPSHKLSNFPPTPAKRPSGKPDVLVILCDDFNPFYAGFSGDPDVKTPNLDAIAKEGAVFDNCYCNSPVCMPSRTCLVSGTNCHNTGLWGNSKNFFLPPERTPLFKDFKKTGYTTAMIGKTHWYAGNAYQREFKNLGAYFKGMGIDYYQEVATTFGSRGGRGVYQNYLRKIGKYKEHSADMTRRLAEDQYYPEPSVLAPEEGCDWMMTDYALNYFKQAPKTLPFFLMVGISNPHTPMDPAGQYATMYEPEALKLRPNVSTPLEKYGKTYDEALIRKTRAAYLGKITLIDDLVGRMVQALKDRGTWDNTIVVLTADHGLQLGEHGSLTKGRFFEESARVPMIMRLPGVTDAGQRISAFAQMPDLYPTVLEAVGGKLSHMCLAKSQLPVLKQQKKSVRQDAFCEIADRRKFGYMVRHGAFKWFVQEGEEHLYNLEEDPYEMNNLIDRQEHQAEVARLQSRLREFLMTEQINYSAGYLPLTQRMRRKRAKEAKQPDSES